MTTGWVVLLVDGTAWIGPAVGAHGIVLVFLFCAEHEAIHFTAFRTHPFNWVVAWIAGILLILPPAWFRCFHLAHHRWTQDPERDPELTTPKPQTLSQYLWWISGVPFWKNQLAGTIQHAIGRVPDAFIAPRSHGLIVREARTLWLIYIALAVAGITVPLWREILMLWILPALVGQPFLRLYLLAEHAGCAYVSDMLVNSRTTRTNSFIRNLAWNMPYHVEHHFHPGVPFHALAELHCSLAAHTTHIDRGYLSVHAQLLKAITTGRDS